jgi:hypothetical protein
MKTITTVLLLMLLLPIAIHAQRADFEYGSESDLKGKTKLYINTGTDTKSRDKIIKSVAKLNLKIVSSGEAEIVILFGAWTDTGILGIPQQGGGTLIVRPEYPSAKASVFVIANDNKALLVYNFEDVQSTAFERKPITNFCKEFVKRYKQANGLK